MSDSSIFRKGVKVVIVKRFVFESLAQIYKSKLADVGIQSFISNAHTSTMIPFVEGGFTLHVNETDQLEALAIIREMDENYENRPDQDFKDADLEEIEYEKKVHEHSEKLRLSSAWDLLIYGAIIAVIVLTLYFMFQRIF